MKCLRLATVLLLAGCAASAQTKKTSRFEIDGKISGSPERFVYLTYADSAGKLVHDSCFIHTGQFAFTGIISEPTLAFLQGNRKIMDDAENMNEIDFFLEPMKMQVSVYYNKFKLAVIKGSATQVEYEQLQKRQSLIDGNASDVAEQFSKFSHDFIVSQPNSYLSGFQLSLYKTRWPIDSVALLYNKLAPAIQNSGNGRGIKAVVDEANENAPGKMAKGFTAVDINGQQVSLSDFKGRYVLVDFWGSWCIPCRQSFPHLLELYNAFHEKGFEVLAVDEEYDGSQEKWKEAVKKDGTARWHNIQSGVEIKNGSPDLSQTITKLYGVHSFPSRFLVDPNGFIIARYIGTDNDTELDRELTKIFR